MGRWVRDERDDIIYVGICQLASGCGVGSVAGCARPCDGECGGSARPSCRACAVLKVWGHVIEDDVVGVGDRLLEGVGV
eukprot:8726062-Pyramimonas_sp.AAC.1